MATEGIKKVNVVSSGNIYLLFSWKEFGEQSIANNYTPILWELQLVSAGGGANIQSTAKKDWSVTVDGKTWSGTNTIGLAAGTAKTLASGEKNIYHNTDGTKTFSYSFSQEIAITFSGSYVGTKSGSGTGTLNTIPRAATLTAAPHFTDEENPTITYSNPAGNAVTSLKACIANATGTVVYADYRDISKTGTSYTFNLTDEERNELRWATINSPNLTVKFYVTTVIGGVTYYSTLDKIMTITNANPTITTTIKDVGTASTVLTGDGNKIIKGLNYISASMTATAKKGASIKTQTITNGSTTLNGSGAFTNVESGVFTVTAKDSRGYATTQTITKEVVDYVKLTCNMDVENPTTDGKTTLTANGNYFNGSFGAVNNTLQIQYRYKENEGNYSDWINTTANITNNTYNSTTTVASLNYQSAYTFQVRAIDKALTVASTEKRVKSIPVFDWGENDFQFNVPVYDKDGGKLGTELTATDYNAASLSGKSFLESGWVTITPTANTPTGAFVTFKKHYTKKPVVLVTASSGVIGQQVLGVSTNGNTNDGVNIVITRTNATPTTVYYYIFGEVE